MKRYYSLMYKPPTMANDDCGDYVLYREAQDEIAEAVWIIEYLNEGGDPIADDCPRVSDFLTKHRGK